MNSVTWVMKVWIGIRDGIFICRTCLTKGSRILIGSSLPRKTWPAWHSLHPCTGIKQQPAISDHYTFRSWRSWCLCASHSNMIGNWTGLYSMTPSRNWKWSIAVCWTPEACQTTRGTIFEACRNLWRRASILPWPLVVKSFFPSSSACPI